MGRFLRHLALAVCACAVALTLTCTNAMSQDKQLPPLGDEPPPPPPNVQSVEGDLGKKDAPPASGTPAPARPNSQDFMRDLGRALFSPELPDVEASRSLTAALARDPCDKSLREEAEAQLSADSWMLALLQYDLGLSTVAFGVNLLDVLDDMKDLVAAQASLAAELIRARAMKCVSMAAIPPPQQPQTPGPSPSPSPPPTTTCKPCEEYAKQIAEIDEQLKNQREQDRRLRRQANLNDSGIQRALDEIKAKIAELEAKRKQVQAKKEECERGCKEGSMIERPTGQYYVSVDGRTWCTYGDGRGTYVALTPTDSSGVPVAFAPGKPVDAPQLTDRAPTTPRAPPTVVDRPPAAPGTPPPTTGRPPPTTSVPPTTPDTPTTTTDAPPTTVTPSTPDTPPQIPDTIFVKTSEAVLEGGQTGSELQNQTVKLVFAKPDLPASGQGKSAQDTGFDRDPAQCTTGASGGCKIQVHPDDRPLYGLASAGAKPGHYRLDLNLLKHSGAVVETTGKTGKPDLKNATPAGGNVADTDFKIGNRKFTRLGINSPHRHSENLAAYSRALGSNAETDYCRTKKPGPPLGLEPASLGALNHELPERTVRLEQHRTHTGMR